jgi:NAD-dependent deacetylase
MQAVPHAGYHALVALEGLVPSLAVVTQNVDGLHERAGSRDVVELHGNIGRLKCLDRHHPFAGEILDDGAEEADPPPCPVCGSPLRPDVVWFGETLPQASVERAWRLASECDVLLLVGTSGTVWPAAELPHVAARAGARVVEVNPAPSELTPLAGAFLQGAAGEVLPRLVAAVQERTEEER